MTHIKGFSILAGIALAAALVARSDLASAALGCKRTVGVGATGAAASCSDGSATTSVGFIGSGVGFKAWRLNSNLTKDIGPITPTNKAATGEVLTLAGIHSGCIAVDSKPANNISTTQNCTFNDGDPAGILRLDVGDDAGT